MQSELWIKKGNEFSARGNFSEAVLAYQKAIELEPDNVLGWGNLGVVQEKLGQDKIAEVSLRRAIALEPDYSLAQYNLGMLYVKMDKMSKAIQYLEKAVKLNPDNPTYALHHGIAAQRLGKTHDEISSFEKLIKLHGDKSGICYRLWLAYRQLILWGKIEVIKPYLQADLNNDPFISVVMSEDPAQNLRDAKRVADSMKVTTPYTSYPKPRGKIRIGYFSSDLREHPVGQMISGMMSLHNRTKFEIIALSSGSDDKSELRKTIIAGVDSFVDLSKKMTDQQMAKRIYDEHIDILVELTGYTKDKRTGVCAYRPARIQMEWLGFPGTIGADFIDYAIVDKIVVPPDQQQFYSEKLLYLPHCYQVNTPQTISKKTYSKSKWGLPDKGFIFGSFVQQHKIDPIIWDIWMNILRRVPNSVLWLWNQRDEACDHLREEAVARGTDPKRLVFSKMAKKDVHLARLQYTDLALDTLVYGGHTTTTDYVWAGVPVITLLGSHFASRVGASILTEAGLGELVTHNLQEYEELAVSLSQNPKKLEELKKKIIHEKLCKNLFNTERFVRDLEAIYESVL